MEMGVQVQAVEQIHEAAQAQAAAMMQDIDLALDYERKQGVLDKCRLDENYNKIIKYLTLYQMKESESYKKRGLSWAEVCAAQGMSVRTVDDNLKNLRIYFEDFSAFFAEFFTLPFNKVRFLGQAVSAMDAEIENNELVIGDVRIALEPENKPAIEAAIDTLKEELKTRNESLKAGLAKEQKDRDKIIKEAVKGLETENKVLVQKIHEIEKKLPKDYVQFAENEFDDLEQHLMAFTTRANKLMTSDEIKTDRVAAGKLFGMLDSFEMLIDDLRVNFDHIRTDEELEIEE